MKGGEYRDGGCGVEGACQYVCGRCDEVGCVSGRHAVFCPALKREIEKATSTIMFETLCVRSHAYRKCPHNLFNKVVLSLKWENILFTLAEF